MKPSILCLIATASLLLSGCIDETLDDINDDSRPAAAIHKTEAAPVQPINDNGKNL